MRFSLDSVASTTFAGQWDGERWNGWPVPRFDAATMLHILTLVSIDTSTGVDTVANVVFDPLSRAFSWSEADEVFGVEPGTDGLYVLEGWCWWPSERPA
jgi:hypothetical protein